MALLEQYSETDLLAERAHRKRQLAAGFRIFGRFGLTEGTAGHLTVRDPVDPDTFWAARYGQHFSLVKVSDLLRTDALGTVYESAGEAHPAALVIHGAIHDIRPDVMAAGHAHSDYGRRWRRPTARSNRSPRTPAR